LIHADKYLRDLIQPADNVGFVEASVGRMVPVMTDEMREGCITRVWVEPFCTLPVDKAAFKNPVPGIKGMLPSEPFEYYIQSKLYLHNMGHAIAAYMGMEKGCEYIWQAMEDREIYETVKSAMYASALALHLEHNKPEDEIIAYADDLMFRFQNKYLGDTTKRVGRDVQRKLSPKDRLLGALALCQKHHVPAGGIKRGIIAALDYIYEGEDHMNKKELLKHIGSVEQIGGVRDFTFNDGKAKGVRAIEVNTGSLRFTVLPDRCMDIAQAEYKGTAISWISKTGITSPQY
jgi:mannitol-1-phosphate 5-dehydrogenase